MKEKGFSLLEVMFSLVLMAIVILSLSHSVIQGEKMLSYQQEKEVMLNLATSRMESLRAEDNISPGTSEEILEAKEAEYICKIKVDENKPGLLTVKIEVYLPDKKERKISLLTRMEI